MAEFQKFTDLIKWVVNWATNDLPPLYEKAEEALQAAKDAKRHKEETEKLVYTHATTDCIGGTIYATEGDIKSGKINRSITAEQFKRLNDTVDQMVLQGAPDATDDTKGIAMLATADEAIEAVNTDKMMSPAMVKEALGQFGLFGEARVCGYDTGLRDVNEIKATVVFIKNGLGLLNDPFSSSQPYFLFTVAGGDGYALQTAIDENKTERRRIKKAGTWGQWYSPY